MIDTLTARYRPPTLPGAVVVFITTVFALLAFSRGLAWIIEPGPDAVGRVLAGTWFGLRTWGALLAIGAVLLIAAMLARRHFAVWCSHAVLASAYAGIAMAVLASVLDEGTGAVALVTPIGGVIWHTLMTWRMKPVIRAVALPPTVSEDPHGQRARR